MPFNKCSMNIICDDNDATATDDNGGGGHDDGIIWTFNHGINFYQYSGNFLPLLFSSNQGEGYVKFKLLFWIKGVF